MNYREKYLPKLDVDFCDLMTPEAWPVDSDQPYHAYRELAIEIVAQAARDFVILKEYALWRPGMSGAEIEKHNFYQSAERFLFGGSKFFRLICDNLGVDAEILREAIKKATFRKDDGKFGWILVDSRMGEVKKRSTVEVQGGN